MVDLAIASSFARELTEDQFTKERTAAQRHRAAQTAPGAQAGAASGTRRASRVESAAGSGPHAATGSGPRAIGPARSALARLMSRLVQVRG